MKKIILIMCLAIIFVYGCASDESSSGVVIEDSAAAMEDVDRKRNTGATVRTSGALERTQLYICCRKHRYEHWTAHMATLFAARLYIGCVEKPQQRRRLGWRKKTWSR